MAKDVHTAEDHAEETIKRHGIRPTAIRIMLLRTAEEMGFAFSISDIEKVIPSLDRSTIFRTLVLFEEQGLLHSVDDGSGTQKYCTHEEDEREQHVHITCTKCHKTYCCKNIIVPKVSLPDGFSVSEVSYVVKGMCKECRRKEGTL